MRRIAKAMYLFDGLGRIGLRKSVRMKSLKDRDVAH